MMLANLAQSCQNQSSKNLKNDQELSKYINNLAMIWLSYLSHRILASRDNKKYVEENIKYLPSGKGRYLQSTTNFHSWRQKAVSLTKTGSYLSHEDRKLSLSWRQKAVSLENTNSAVFPVVLSLMNKSFSWIQSWRWESVHRLQRKQNGTDPVTVYPLYSSKAACGVTTLSADTS